MIVLFTDYGLEGPYLGQVEAVLYREAPDEKIINLLADAPRQNPKASAYLLDALTTGYPENTIFFCVVDPGVGGFEDSPVVIKFDNRWFIGPDNGLFDIVVRQAEYFKCWKIHWRPENLSSSFHGRDLYAPVCAMIANGIDIPGEKVIWEDKHSWPDELNEIIYIDHFGNCMTAMKMSSVDSKQILSIGNHNIKHATTFADAKDGKAFWYENSNGLVEIAVNQGSAEEILGLTIGSAIAN